MSEESGETGVLAFLRDDIFPPGVLLVEKISQFPGQEKEAKTDKIYFIKYYLVEIFKAYQADLLNVSNITNSVGVKFSGLV